MLVRLWARHLLPGIDEDSFNKSPHGLKTPRGRPPAEWVIPFLEVLNDQRCNSRRHPVMVEGRHIIRTNGGGGHHIS